MADYKAKLLSNAGVKLSKDGKCIYNYNPQHFQAVFNWAFAAAVLPQVFLRSLWLQLGHLYFIAHSWRVFTPHGSIDTMAIECYSEIAPLSRFVLGLYVSLVLGKTY